jgi:acyl-coenzyme A thioesterase PaaI-like protein
MSPEDRTTKGYFKAIEGPPLLNEGIDGPRLLDYQLCLAHIVRQASPEGSVVQLDLESARQMVERGSRFVANTGLRVVELRPGYAKCMMPLEGNENHISTMNAGALFTLAEITGGALFVATFDVARYFAVVVEMNIQFVKPADSAVSIEVQLNQERISSLQEELLQNGKVRFELVGELKSATGAVVARSRGLYQIRKSREAAAA